MPTCPRPIEAERGFTLIEMLVVLTVLGLAAAVMATQSGGADRFARERSALAFRAAIDAARRDARSSGRPAIVRPAGIDDRARIAGAVFAHSGMLAFYPDGSSSGGMIMLGDRPLLTIEWLTGEVRRAQ